MNCSHDKQIFIFSSNTLDENSFVLPCHWFRLFHCHQINWSCSSSNLISMSVQSRESRRGFQLSVHFVSIKAIASLGRRSRHNNCWHWSASLGPNSTCQSPKGLSSPAVWISPKLRWALTDCIDKIWESVLSISIFILYLGQNMVSK